MLTTREAAERLGIQPRAIAKLIARGQLAATWNEAHTRLRIAEEEIERYQRERRPAHRPKTTA